MCCACTSSTYQAVLAAEFLAGGDLCAQAKVRPCLNEGHAVSSAFQAIRLSKISCTGRRESESPLLLNP